MKKNSVSKILFLFGIVLLFFGVYLIFERYNPKRLEFQNVNSTPKTSSAILPKEIEIPDLNIHLAIYPAKITNSNWETTTKGVSLLSSSPIPGNNGNSILYGHNWESLLGPLVKIKPGEIVKITYPDKSVKIFKVEYTQIVSPSNVEILNQTKDKRITIYTCTGFLDSKRFVAVAVLKES